MAFARKRDTMRPGQQLTQLEGPLLAQTGRSASAGVGYSRVEANLKRNLDDVSVVETNGAECGDVCKFASNSDPLRGIIASNSDPF